MMARKTTILLCFICSGTYLFCKNKKSFQQPDCFSKNEEPFKRLETLISWEVFLGIVIKILLRILSKVK